jgi:hypothetical protein
VSDPYRTQASSAKLVVDNPYINGLDFSPDGNLHVTWTYRDYVPDNASAVAVQAGPNGPENNHDLVYAYSEDLGSTWNNNWGQRIADVAQNKPILPTSAGATMVCNDNAVHESSSFAMQFSIPKYGGILNQEAQTVDTEGRVHVLNRENGTGVEQWFAALTMSALLAMKIRFQVSLLAQHNSRLESYSPTPSSGPRLCDQCHCNTHCHRQAWQAFPILDHERSRAAGHPSLECAQLDRSQYLVEYGDRTLPRLDAGV